MLQIDIEKLFDEKPEADSEADFRTFQAFKDALDSGAMRAAEPDAATRSGWRVNRSEFIPDVVQGAARL